MTREIPTALASKVAAEENRPLELFEVFLDTETLFLAQAEDHVVFGVQTYTAAGISREPVRTSLELEVDECSVRIDNVDLAFSQRAIATDFIGRQVVVKKVDRDALGSSTNFLTVFDGRMDEPVLDQQTLSVKVRSWLDALHHVVPRRVFSTLCNYQHYDASCAVSRTLGTNLVTGTAIGSSTDEALVAAVLSGFASAYWGPIGTLKFHAGSNANVGREVIGSDQGSNSVSVRIPFPVSIHSGDVFSLSRGCRKTLADCMSKYDNFLNYGGFPTTPKHPLL